MEIKYYRLDYQDIEAISEMEKRFFGQPWSPASIATYAEKGSTIFVVAKDAEKVVGYAALMCVLNEGNLVSIAVEEEYRKIGIATEILDILYEDAIGRGVNEINLEVRRSNQSAIELYKKEEFKFIGERKDFYSNPKEDALLYLKRL